MAAGAPVLVADLAGCAARDRDGQRAMGVSLAEALVRRRAYAYAEGRPLNEVAADVLARRLRLGDNDS